MRRLCVLAAAFVTPALAQFAGLHTTQTGDALYFSSPVRPAGSEKPFYSRIYRWNAQTGVQIVAEVNDRDGGDCERIYYQLYEPQVSLDGSVWAYTGSGPVASRSCSEREPNEGVIRAGPANPTRRIAGRIALSPNGRYAISSTARAASGRYHLVTDLVSGLQSVVAGGSLGVQARVTNDGSLIDTESTAIFLASRTGETRVFPTEHPDVDDAVIDPGGSIIVYRTRLGPGRPARLSRIAVATGVETSLASGFGFSRPALSADGRTLYFWEAGGDTLGFSSMSTSGGPVRRFNIPSADFAVSGDGRVAFLSTASGLVRVDLETRETTVLVPPTPYLTNVYRGYEPSNVVALGSSFQISGAVSGLRSVRLCGEPMTIQENQPSFVRLEAPWTLKEGDCDLVASSASPFEHGLSVSVRVFDPLFVRNAVFNSQYQYNSSSTPFRAGDLLIAYMTGLGPLAGGALAQPGFSCQIGGLTATVEFAGAAPGYPGYYQINVRAPPGDPGFRSLSCGLPDAVRGTIGVWVAP